MVQERSDSRRDGRFQVSEPIPSAGYFSSGQPFNRFGHGPRNLVILQGLLFENKPLPGLMGHMFPGMYRFLEDVLTFLNSEMNP